MKQLMLGIAFGAAVLSSAAGAQPAGRSVQQPDLTWQQASERAQQLFQTFDLNHDGIVTRREAQRLGTKLMLVRAKSGVDPTPGLGGHTIRFLKHTFAGMQSVTEEEFEQAFLSHFDEMDTNHDGVLTAAEREQGRNQQASR